MGVKREKPEDLGLKLRQFEVLQGQGKALTDAVGQIGDTVQTYYRWRKDYGGMGRDPLERAKQFTKLQNQPDEILDGLQELPLAVCSVRAVDVLDAFEQAEHAISKELGLNALMSGRGKFIFNNGPDRPINMTLLAPHMTVHEPDGSISVEMYWYNR